MAKLFSDGDFADSVPAASVLSESDFSDSVDPGQVFSESDFADSPGQDKVVNLRKRLKQKDSLLNKIGYVKNRTKDDKPDAEGLTLDDYRNFVTSSDFNTLDEERLNLVAQAVDAKHAETAKKRGFGRIIMDAGARGFQRAVNMDRASNFVGKKVDQESSDARQALVDVEDETDIAHPRAVGSVKNIRGVVDAVTMAAESIAENIPNMLIPVASSIAGAKTGGVIGASGGPAGALAGATIGAMTGGFLGSLRMNVGEAVMDQTREGLELNRGLALGQGVGYSLLDMGGAEVAAARRIARGTLAVPLREAKKEFVASIGKLAKTIGKDMFREGWTEAAQSGVVGNTRRKIQTGSFVEPGKTPGDLVWNALDEAYGGAFAGGGMSMVTTGYQYAGNKKMVKHADAEISRMAQDTDIAKLDPYDRVILAKTRVNMAVRADIESALSDIEGTRKQMVDDFLESKQSKAMTEAERTAHIEKNLSHEAIHDNLTKTIENIDKYDVEARDTLGGTAKTVLNAYESEFSNMSIDDVPTDYKSDFDSSEIAGMRDSKIIEPDGSETYKGPKTDIMIEGRPGAYSIRNNNGMKMPIGESGVVDTLEEAVSFASKLARFNQYRIDNNASKAAFIKGVAEKSHPGANVVQVDSPKQIKDPDARARMVGGEQAFYNPKDNTVYVMLDSIQNPAQAEIMLQHEDTHRALLEMMTKEGLINPGESVDSAKRRFFGTNTRRGAERSEESVARANERGGADRGGLEKFRDLAQRWISKKTGIKSLMGDAELRLLLDKLNAINKQGTGGTVDYQAEGQSDANKIRYQDSFYGQGTLEEQAQRQNDSAPDVPVSQARVINRDTKRSGLIAGMNQPTEPSVIIEKTSVPQETDRPTRHRVFEGGSPITVSNPNALKATDTTKAYRLTNQSQVDDMLETGGVRAREGKMKGGHTGEVHWSLGHETLGYNPSDGKYVIETDSSNLNEREGVLPNSAVRLWKAESGKWVDVTNTLAPKRESTPTSTVRSFVRTELRTDRIMENHADLFQQAMDVTDNDEQAAAGLVSEWLAGQNIADKSVPDSVRVASKLEQKADLSPKDVDILEQNAIFGKDLFLFGYRKDKQTGSWKFQETVQKPAQEAPQSTPVEPVTPEPVVADKPAEPKPSAGDKMRRESFSSFFKAANVDGKYDLLQRWYEGNGLFGKPSKTAGGEYDAYRALPPNLKKMIRGKSKLEITSASKELAEEFGPEYADPVIGPELLVNEFVRQYGAYQGWKENGAVPDVQADEYAQRAKAEHRQEQEDLASYKRKVDNGEVIENGTFVWPKIDTATAKTVGVDPDYPVVRVEHSYVKGGVLVYKLSSPSGKLFNATSDGIEATFGKEEVIDDEDERSNFEYAYELSELIARKVREDREREYLRIEREGIEGEAPLQSPARSKEAGKETGSGTGKVAARGKNDGSLFDESDLDFNLDGGTKEDVVRIAAEKKADEDLQAEAKRKLDAAPVLPMEGNPVVATVLSKKGDKVSTSPERVQETPKTEQLRKTEQFKRGTKIATTRNADGVSYFGEVLQSNPDGTVKIRAFKEKTKGTIGAKGYGVDSKDNRVTKDIDVPAESVKSVDATADTSKMTDEERRKLKMAEKIDAANADNELLKGNVEAPRDIVDSFNSAKERKEQRKTDNGSVMFRRAISDKGYFKASNALVTEPGEVRFRRSYHGSPHLFDKFNIGKIGTGEGNQAYGWGLYFAEAKAVATEYAGKLFGRSQNGKDIRNLISQYSKEMIDADKLISYGGKWHYIIEGKTADKYLSPEDMRPDGSKNWSFVKATKEELEQARRRYAEAKKAMDSYKGMENGIIYTVELDVEDNELLDYERKIAESSYPMKAVNELFYERFGERNFFQGVITGGDFYNMVSKAVAEKMGQLKSFSRQLEASEAKIGSDFFRDAGIKGIRYLDEGSRTTSTTSPTYNYVIFDDKLIKITKRNEAEAKGYGERGEAMFRRSTVTPEQDADYLRAVEAGDRDGDNLVELLRKTEKDERDKAVAAWLERNPETAKRLEKMVEDRARAVGYDIKAFHGTDKEFNRFKHSLTGSHWFASNQKLAQNYGKTTMRVFLKLTNPFRDERAIGVGWDGGFRGQEGAVFTRRGSMNNFLQQQSEAQSFVRENFGNENAKEFFKTGFGTNAVNAHAIVRNIKDGESVKDLLDRVKSEDIAEEIYAVVNTADIKLADPVTYDDAGNVIPLSQRFNSETPDIRFRRAMSGIPSGADILDTETGLQAARRIVQDYMQPWERKQEALQKTLKRKLSDDVDVYRAEDRSYGLIRNGVHQFEKNFIDKAERVLNENGLTVDEFDQFLMAKAGPDRNKMIADRTDGKNLTGSGQSDVYWNNILAAYRKQGKYDKLNEAAEHVWALNRAVLDMKVEAGLMSKAQADVWKTKSPFYVPLRSDDAEADYKELGKRASFSLKRKESKSATGRAEGHEADTPFAFSVMQSLEAVGRANKNVVYETAAKLIEQNPSDLWRIETRIPTKQAYDADTGKVISVPDTQFEDAPNVVIVKRDGKKQYLVFEGADGLKLARSLKKDSLQKAPVIVSALTRTYAMMRTAMVPTFILRNLRADFLQLTINMTAENKFKMVPKVFRNMKDSWVAVFTYERDGKAKGALSAYANEFFSNGGQIAGVGVQTVDKINQTLNRHVKKHGKFMTNFGMPAINFYEYIERGNATIETGTRLALYATLRKQGYSISDSIEAGKNITVNFNRKGELGPLVNSLYMFSNVAVQDAARSVKALSGKNGKAVVLGLLGAGFLAAMLNNVDDDEEDKTGAGNYKNIPESDKQRNIIIKVGGKYVKQPIRGIWAWVYYAGTKAGDVAFGKYDSAKAAKNVAGAALDTVNFLGTSGSVTQFIMPTIVDPVIQHGENRDWKGSPIYQRKFTEAQPDSATGMKRTPNWMKSAAKGLNRLTGGDDATKGWIDVAPETIKFVIDTMAGGLGTDLSYGVGFAADAAKGEFDVDKTPFFRDVIRDLPDTTRRYYEAKDKFDAGVYAVNHYKTAKERSEYYRKNPFMKPTTADRIKALNKTIKELREKESKTEVKERKASHEARRLRLQSTVLRLMSEGSSK